MLTAFAALMMPSVIYLHRKGNFLRHIVLWLGIFLGLALFYQFFGPFGTDSDRLPVNSRIEEGEGEGEGNDNSDDGNNRPQLEQQGTVL